MLRVARFAARFGFVAPETEALFRALVASGELPTLAPERVWHELATGLMEPYLSRLAVLRDCAALPALLPEVDALFGVPQRVQDHPEIDAGVHVARALDYAAGKSFALPVRYGVLVHDLGKGATPRRSWPNHAGHETRSIRLVERLSARLRVPAECRDAGQLVARWHGGCTPPASLRPRRCSISCSPRTRSDAPSVSIRCSRRASATRCHCPDARGSTCPPRTSARLSSSSRGSMPPRLRVTRRAKPARGQPDDAIAKAKRGAAWRAARMAKAPA